ncbi:MAG: hypothetical protein HQL76_13190 [Magnetococcales bacterium]|nr:hypothetical protein [Magnetococcales bacterium]
MVEGIGIQGGLRRRTRRVAFVLALFMMTGCRNPGLPVSSAHLHPQSDPRQGTEADIPRIVQATPRIPPPAPPEERYTIVVFDVPVREVLFTLVRNSRITADIHPDISGRVTLNAVDQPLTVVLERLSRQVDMVYDLKGTNLVIRPDRPYWHTYKVDYLNMKRESSSEMNLSLEQGGGEEGASAGSAGITAKLEMDFWEPISEGIRKIIQVDNADRAKRNKGGASDALTRPPVDPTPEVSVPGERGRSKDGGNDPEEEKKKEGDESLVIHKGTGVVSVFATRGQQRRIQEFLDMIVATAQQQVLIEATVVEIKLNEYHIHGVDWSRVTGGETGTRVEVGETVVSGGETRVMDLLDAGGLTRTFGGSGRQPFVGVGHQFKTGGDKSNVIGVSLRMLDEFGDVTVLSSPKVMALNNQTAVMKVGDQHIYFETKFEETTTESDTSNTVKKKGKTTFVKKEALEGLILSVTPNVERSGIVSLHVRPVLSQKISDFIGPDGNAYPLFQVREMDSVLRVGTGQVVVLGGLMKDFAESRKTGLPGLRDLPFVEPLFGASERTRSKTEMAIFIRPTVMTPDTMRQRQDSIRFSVEQAPAGKGSMPALE